MLPVLTGFIVELNQAEKTELMQVHTSHDMFAGFKSN